MKDGAKASAAAAKTTFKALSMLSKLEDKLGSDDRKGKKKDEDDD